MSSFKTLNNVNQQINNTLINESERNATISTNSPSLSVFDKSFQQATTFNSGLCIPIFFQEVYPKDIYDIDINNLIRMSSPSSTPLMNLNYDINFFFVPSIQIDPQFKELCGENPNYGFTNGFLEFPMLNCNGDFSYNENDLANYLNVPINVNYGANQEQLNLTPFLVYGKVWNEWYRDQNLQDSIDTSTCFNNSRKINSSNYNSNMSFYESIIYGKGLAPASKLPDYFTNNLPYQQKGLPLDINGTALQNIIVDSIAIRNKSNLANGPIDSTTAFSPQWYVQDQTTNDKGIYAFTTSNKHLNSGNYYLSASTKSNTTPFNINYGGSDSVNSFNGFVDLETVPTSGVLTNNVNSSEAYTINDLRYSVTMQHLLEDWALCGSRYVEQLRSIWGIKIDPKLINRSELIGGTNETLLWNNVQQTSSSTSTSPLGDIATNLFNSVSCPHISYASEQYGYIIGILVVRTKINYGGQGLPKIFSYKNFFDLFNPMFNGIGEQPTLSKELFYSDTNNNFNNSTFGFNEPFINTKYNIDNANGFLSLNSKYSLFSLFLYGEKYNDNTLLSDNWIRYNSTIIDNTLFKLSENTNQFYHQFLSLFSFNVKYTTSQPLFSTHRVYGI